VRGGYSAVAAAGGRRPAFDWLACSATGKHTSADLLLAVPSGMMRDPRSWVADLEAGVGQVGARWKGAAAAGDSCRSLAWPMHDGRPSPGFQMLLLEHIGSSTEMVR
jgi:hypothetical protein